MRPPRNLKAPIGVWFSCLTHNSAPSRRDKSGQQYCGVGGTTRCTSAAAASSAPRSAILTYIAIGARRQAESPRWPLPAGLGAHGLPAKHGAERSEWQGQNVGRPAAVIGVPATVIVVMATVMAAMRCRARGKLLRRPDPL